jgi:hypothetical protein
MSQGTGLMLFGGERNCRAPECAVKKWQLVLSGCYTSFYGNPCSEFSVNPIKMYQKVHMGRYI